MEDLARQLIGVAGERTAGCPGDDGEEDDVLLDVEVDGFRCLLLRTRPRTVAGAAALSPREREIARMVALGHANKTIAAALDISSWTVSSHLRRIFTKLGVGSRAAMVARMLDQPLAGASSTADSSGAQDIQPLHQVPRESQQAEGQRRPPVGESPLATTRSR